MGEVHADVPARDVASALGSLVSAMGHALEDRRALRSLDVQLTAVRGYLAAVERLLSPGAALTRGGPLVTDVGRTCDDLAVVVATLEEVDRRATTDVEYAQGVVDGSAVHVALQETVRLVRDHLAAVASERYRRAVSLLPLVSDAEWVATGGSLVRRAIDLLEQLNVSTPGLWHLITPAVEWLRTLATASDSAALSDNRDGTSDLALAEEGALAAILVGVQAATAAGRPAADVPSSTPSHAATLRSTAAALRLDIVAAALARLFESVQYGGMEDGRLALARLQPMLHAYVDICGSHLGRIRVHHEAQVRLASSVSVIVARIAREGFCRPPDETDEGEAEAGGAGAGQDSEGTGLGSGAGSNDISNQIEDQAQVEGLAEGDADADADAGAEGAADGPDDAVDVEQDIGGASEAVDEQAEDKADGDAGADGGDENAVEDQFDAVDPADAVDESFWAQPPPAVPEPGQEQSTAQTEAGQGEVGDAVPGGPELKADGPTGDATDDQPVDVDGPPDTDGPPDMDPAPEDGQTTAPSPAAEPLGLPDEPMDLDLPDPKADAGEDEAGDLPDESHAQPGRASPESDVEPDVEPDTHAAADQPTGALVGVRPTDASGDPAEDVDQVQSAAVGAGATGEQDAAEPTGGGGDRASETSRQAQEASAPEASPDAPVPDADQSEPRVPTDDRDTASARTPRLPGSGGDPGAGDAAEVGDVGASDVDTADAEPSDGAEPAQSRPDASAIAALRMRLDAIRQAASSSESRSSAPDAGADFEHADEPDADLALAPTDGRDTADSAAVDDAELEHAPGSGRQPALPTDGDRDERGAAEDDAAMAIDEPATELDAVAGRSRSEPAASDDAVEGDALVTPGLVHSWQQLVARTAPAAANLAEQLRIILEPTRATRLRGDYRTGKRLNMRRVIQYIASDYTKDKIWLRRTQPSAREYDVMLALDDSRSMADSDSVALALDSIALVSTALTRLEAGDIAIARFGRTTDIVHPFGSGPLSGQLGQQVVDRFAFDQTATDVADLLDRSLAELERARSRRSGQTADELWQLLVIVSDGVCQDMERVRALLRMATAQRVLVVFIVIDALRRQPTAAASASSSIVSMQSASYVRGADGNLELKLVRYMDTFPFEFFVVLRSAEALPDVLSRTLRQFFESVRFVWLLRRL